MQTLEQIIDELQSISDKAMDSYSLADRHRINQLRIPLAKAIAKAKQDVSESDRQRKLYRAKQMKLTTGTVKDRESEIEESEGYQQRVVATIKAQYIVDLCSPLLQFMSVMWTTIRDAVKILDEEIRQYNQ